MKKYPTRKLLSLMLVICMVLSMAAPVAAAPASSKITFNKVDNGAVTAGLLTKADDDLNTMESYVDSDVVRVSIFLDDQSTVMAGYSIDSIAANGQARAYRSELKAKQEKITAAIEKTIGSKLDVVWNLTLAANLISANVKYGQIGAIEKVAGVSKVLIETCYAPDVAEAKGTVDPNMATSSAQIGSAAAWASGYTGIGSRIAVIDTGSDTDHQSLDPAAFEYSLAYWAGMSGLSIDEYIASIDLLDAEEIDAVAEDLNAPVGADAYVNSKIPFGYNYIDKNLNITHDFDSQGSHGSHVAGIATANAYIADGEGFAPALQSALMQGVAPDAQLITMKVFGKAGGAYDSDYMAAIEDAVVLGCDAANLSLGSGNPGPSRCATPEYQAILDSLTEAGMVVAMSAGNSGYWAESAYNLGYLYSDDVSMQTDGSPGSYTNSLAVASVDNDGKTGNYITVGDQMIMYNEMLEGNSGPYKNKPFTTIAGDHEYVFIDGIGSAEEWAAVGDALEGKIALCFRGELSFFEKAVNAIDAGAIATFIVNNQAGIINMDLSDYPYTQPCASLTLNDGMAIAACSEPVVDEEGNVLYYTGKMHIAESLGVGQFNSPYYTMSSFSSWGVPGSLELKPEITAPGGEIFSINGVDTSGKAYEVMGGTSMASPQVAGMAALIAQYIREEGLVEATGLTPRQLAQSLLMSTAVPMLDSYGDYYPVIQQGSGLANVGAAISADSYITMAEGMTSGAADGKVKVELGDDPDRIGAYSATFTLNNLTDMEKAFDLGANFFIQAPVPDGDQMYMYTATALIGADVSWTVNGAAVEPSHAYAGLDFNGDGAVNSDDGQAILDYATGSALTLTNADRADLDADGDVDSHDAYLFLSGLNAAVAVLPAGGSAEVTVNISLSDMWKDTLDYYYPNGTYLQGYIYAETLSDDEGVAGTSHSIPVLGFFGNWSDASMFDVGTAQVYATGEETRIPYLGDAEANTFLVVYNNDASGDKYIFGGNPLVTDDTYMPERNAINSADMIAGLSFTAIRNAAESKILIVNETTGEILDEKLLGEVESAFYYVNGQTWENTNYTLSTSTTFDSASEGDQISMKLILAPEYYVDAEGNVDWDALGKGAAFGTTMVIDNTAPVLENVALSLTGNNLTITASDNEYIAAVALYNKNGTQVLNYTGANQEIGKNESADYTLSMEGISGSKFLLQVMDYAMNTTTYVVEMQMGDEVALPDMIAFNLDDNVWSSFSKNSTHEDVLPYAACDVTFYAATIADHYVFACTDTGDLYVMPESDLTDMTFITNLGFAATDMAFNKADGNVYAVASGYLVKIDKLTGEYAIVGRLGLSTSTLACDAFGNFYCNAAGTGDIYTFTLDTIARPELLVQAIDIKSQYVQAMECDPNTGLIYWTSFTVIPTQYMGQIYQIPYSYLVEINPSSGEAAIYEDLYVELSALLIPEKSGGADWAEPVDEISSMSIMPEAIGLVKGSTAELSVNILPWTVSDKSVTWASQDESVATIDANGKVTAVGLGSTVITATSNLDPTVTAEAVITVSTLDYTIGGVLQDAEGNPMFFDWNLSDADTWTGGTAMKTSIASATYDPLGGYVYIQDGSDSGIMKKIDPATGETVDAGPACAFGAAMYDLAAMEIFASADAPAAMGVYGNYVMIPCDPMGNTFNRGWNLASYLATYTGGTKFVAITSMGLYVDEDGVTNELVYALDDSGTIWAMFYDGTTSIGFEFISTDLNLSFPMNGKNQFCSLIDADDGSLFLSYFTGDTNEIYHLKPNADATFFTATRAGDVGADVWPAALLSAKSADAAEHNWKIAPTMSAEAVAIDDAQFAICASAKIDAAAKSVKDALVLNSNSGVSADEKTVTVDITAAEASTNGVMEITWNTDALELVDYASIAAYTSAIEEEGKLTFGYVALTAFEADSTVLSLTFNAKATEDTVVTVNNKQLNNAAGDVEEIKVEFTHANTEIRNAAAATCTEPGYTGDTYCADCGKLLSKGTVIDALGHTFGDWTVSTKPTCSEIGYETRTCSVCGESETRPVAALGHKYEAVVTAPTCTEGGYTTYTCSVCGDSYKADLTEAAGHKYEAVVTEPTCTEGGYTTYTCSVCGDSYKADLTDAHCASSAFADVAMDDWFHGAVDFVVDNGLMKGMSNTIFAPAGTMNRAQMVTVLYRLAGAPAVTATKVFADVPAGEFYTDAVAWAVANGITNGVSETAFNPEGAVTREQMVTFLYRFAKLSGKDVSVSGDLSQFADAAEVSAWAVEAFTWAVENGIISGMTEVTLVPGANTNRAQVATVLMRYMN